MQQGQDFRQIVFKMAETSQPRKQWLRFRETIDTMILGTLSTSTGVVILIVGLQALLGNPTTGGHDLWQGTLMPSAGQAIASIVGEALGLAGVAVGRIRGGVISPLSAVGTVVCLIHMYLFFGHFMLMQLFR